jgi:hypothetical protein
MLIGSSLAACAGESWPGTVRAVGDPRFLAHEQAVRTIDVLPVDLQVWAVPGHERGPASVAAELEGTLDSAASVQLGARGYDVAAHIDRRGRFLGHDGQMIPAMEATDVARVVDSLSSYGAAQSRFEGGLLAPFLPARLGEATGSDATLYIGGWAFAGKDKGSNKAAKVIGTILVVALVVTVVFAILAKSDGAGKGVGKVVEGTGRVAAGAVKVIGRVALTTARTAGRVGFAIMRDPELLQLTVDTMELFVRAGTHVEYYSHRPDYYAEGPRRGRSAMLLEMTLIDNRTGLTLWHARQRFPARPERTADVERAVKRLMATLPAR